MTTLLNLKDARRLFFGGAEIDRVYRGADLLWDRPSDAMWSIWNETQGLAIDFADGFYSSTGFWGSAAIKDTTTPANNYDAAPTQTATSLLSYPGASPKLLRGPGGSQSVIRYQAHNLAVQSENLVSSWVQIGCTCTADTVTATGAGAIVYQTFTPVPGATYTFTFEARAGTETVANYYVFNETAGAFIVNTTSYYSSINSSTWTQISVSFTAPAGSSSIRVSPFLSGGSGTSGRTSQVRRMHVRRTPSDDTYLATTSAPRFAMPLEFGPGMTTGTGTQTITVIPGAKYTVQPTGTGSVTLSGAATGTVAGGSRRTIRAATSSLTLTVSGTLTGLEVYRNRGARIEPAATNLLLNSGLTAGAVSGTPGTSPANWGFLVSGGTTTVVSTGGFTGGPHLRLATTSARHILERGLALLANTTYIYWAEVNVRTSTDIQNAIFIAPIPAGATITYRVNGNVVASTDTIPTGRCRLEIVIAVAATAGTVGCRIGPGCGTGNVTADIDYLHVQFETGSTATTPIETYGSTVTRASDLPALAASNFPVGSNMTVAVTFTPIGSDPAYRSILYLGNPNFQNRFDLALQSAQNRFSVVAANVVESDSAGAITPGNSTPSRIAFASGPGVIRASYNGGAAFNLPVLSAPYDPPIAAQLTNLTIGHRLSDVVFNGYVESIVIAPRTETALGLPSFGA